MIKYPKLLEEIVQHVFLYVCISIIVNWYHVTIHGLVLSNKDQEGASPH